jgi:uncharacterized protein Yka (UPF0111/DUF47 family)|tara:strand:- start:29 stop:334 length:306 start_codon:yes stop_codon:yes gene_type:complete
MGFIPKELKQMDAMVDKIHEMRDDFRGLIAAMNRMCDTMEMTAPLINNLSEGMKRGAMVAGSIDRANDSMNRNVDKLEPKLDQLRERFDTAMTLASRLTEK